VSFGCGNAVVSKIEDNAGQSSDTPFVEIKIKIISVGIIKLEVRE
jgi:hypothetical protein